MDFILTLVNTEIGYCAFAAAAVRSFMADSQVFIKIVQNSEDILLASCPTEEKSVCIYL